MSCPDIHHLHNLAWLALVAAGVCIVALAMLERATRRRVPPPDAAVSMRYFLAASILSCPATRHGWARRSAFLEMRDHLDRLEP